MVVINMPTDEETEESKRILMRHEAEHSRWGCSQGSVRGTRKEVRMDWSKGYPSHPRI